VWKLSRRSAVKPVIGRLKSDHRMSRNFLAHARGDAINAVLAAAVDLHLNGGLGMSARIRSVQMRLGKPSVSNELASRTL
jgi:hypothetical protein